MKGNVLKRFGVVGVLLLVFLLQTVMSYANTGKVDRYYIGEIGMSTGVPFGVVVLTRDLSDPNTVLQKMGTTALKQKDKYKKNDIYMEAILDNSLNAIVVTMVEDRSTKEIYDMDGLEEKAVEDLSLAAARKLKDDVDAYVTSRSIYKTAHHNYIVLGWHFTDREGKLSYGLQYYTVQNGMAVNITLRTAGSEAQDAFAGMLKNVVDETTYVSPEEIAAFLASQESTSPSELEVSTAGDEEGVTVEDNETRDNPFVVLNDAVSSAIRKIIGIGVVLIVLTIIVVALVIKKRREYYAYEEGTVENATIDSTFVPSDIEEDPATEQNVMWSLEGEDFEEDNE